MALREPILKPLTRLPAYLSHGKTSVDVRINMVGQAREQTHRVLSVSNPRAAQRARTKLETIWGGGETANLMVRVLL